MAACGEASRGRVRARPGGTGLAIAAIVLLCLCTYGPTIHQRTHYSDDFPNRLAVERSNWWGACQEYWDDIGFIRPLGYVVVMSCQQWLWNYPLAQHSILLALTMVLCLMVYVFALRVTGHERAALAGGAILAAWSSYTSVVVWPATGLEMLPAYIALLAALCLYLRHLRSAVSRAWWFGSVVVFAVSVGFHDQHLGAAAAFTVLACIAAPVGRRLRSVLGTVPFWMMALAVGFVAMLTTRGTARPLEPTASRFLTGLGAAFAGFYNRSVGEPVRDCLHGAGPRESLSRMMAADPALMAVSIALLLLAVWLSLAAFRRVGPRRREYGVARAGWLAVVGATIVLAGVGMMALGDRGYFMPRHTLLPAIGVSMMLGSVFGGAPGLRGLGGRTVGAALLAGLLIGPSVLRLGDTYEWTTRARVTERLLASLDELYPTPEMADLLVIDGVRKYGRGFCNSSGLSGAVSLHRGIEVKVITLVRRERDRLYGNRPWDVRWEIDPDSTPFLVWNEAEGALRAVTFEEFVARHPELKGHSS